MSPGRGLLLLYSQGSVTEPPEGDDERSELELTADVSSLAKRMAASLDAILLSTSPGPCCCPKALKSPELRAMLATGFSFGPLSFLWLNLARPAIAAMQPREHAHAGGS